MLDLFSFERYGALSAPPPGSVFVQEGTQAQGAMPSAAIYTFLKSLFLVESPPVPAGGTQFVARPRDEAVAAGADVSQTAFDALRAAQEGLGQIVVGNVTTASPTRADITIFSAQESAQALAAVTAGSDSAILDFAAAAAATQVAPKKEKGGALLAGAAVGGVIGFMAGGPVGAAAGAGGGALLANWIV